MVLYTEAELQKAYLKFLITLYDVENEGIEVGDYPSYEEFRVIFEEEMSSN